MSYTLHPGGAPPVASPSPAPPMPVSAAFVPLALVTAAAFAVGLSRGGPASRGQWLAVGLGIAAVYLGVSAALAASGAIADADARPPPAGLLLGGLGATTVALGVSRVGDRLLGLPLAVLVGAQSFRIVVEAVLAAAHAAGEVPVEVTWHGLNLDVVAGATAAALGVWLWRGSPPRAVVWAWNVLGLALLAVVVAVAAVSALGVVETSPRLALPVSWPGVWLPAWLVQLALLGHVLVFRALRQQAADGPRA